MAGADFIKTSTGKESGQRHARRVAGDGARVARVPAPRPVISWVTSRPAASRRRKLATQYLALIKEELGNRWLAARPVPLRRVEPAHRHRTPARAPRQRLLQRRASGTRCREEPESERHHHAQDHHRVARHHGLRTLRPNRPLQAQEWLERHNQRKFGHFIGGRWVNGTKHFGTHQSDQRPGAGADRARHTQRSSTQAVQAAEAAACKGWTGAWRPRPCEATCTRWPARCRSTRGCLAVLETLDNGKAIRETRDADVPLAVRHFYHHAGWAQLLSRGDERTTTRWAWWGRSCRGTSRS